MNLTKKMNLYSAFVNFEKGFDWMPGDLWWVIYELDIEEWLVKVVQSMWRSA